MTTTTNPFFEGGGGNDYQENFEHGETLLPKFCALLRRSIWWVVVVVEGETDKGSILFARCRQGDLTVRLPAHDGQQSVANCYRPVACGGVVGNMGVHVDYFEGHADDVSPIVLHLVRVPLVVPHLYPDLVGAQNSDGSNRGCFAAVARAPFRVPDEFHRNLGNLRVVRVADHDGHCVQQCNLPNDSSVRVPVSYTHLTLPTIYSV